MTFLEVPSKYAVKLGCWFLSSCLLVQGDFRFRRRLQTRTLRGKCGHAVYRGHENSCAPPQMGARITTSSCHAHRCWWLYSAVETPQRKDHQRSPMPLLARLEEAISRSGVCSHSHTVGSSKLKPRDLGEGLCEPDLNEIREGDLALCSLIQSLQDAMPSKRSQVWKR